MQSQLITLRCRSCEGRLDVYREMDRLACGFCGTEMTVQRRGGTVSLKPIPDALQSAVQRAEAGTDRTAAELAIVRLEKELAAADPPWPDGTLRMLHELRVHQMELEKENEELRTKQHEMEESIASYVALYDFAPVGFLTVSEKGLILKANLTASGMVAEARSALIGLRFSQLIVREDENVYYLHLGQLFQTGAPQMCNLRLLRKDASPFWAHLELTATREGDGTPVCHLAIIDITERKRAEEALRRSEARHAKLIAGIGDVIVVVDGDGINRYQSPNIERYFGRKAEDVVGASAWTNLHPEDLEGAREFFGNLLRAPDTTATTECRYRCKDGTYKWVEFTGLNLLHDPDVRGVLGNYRDITERKTAREELKQSHELLSNLARLVPGVMYQFRLYPDGRSAFPYASPGINDIYGVTPEEVQEDASRVFGRLHPEDYNRVGAGIQESARTLNTFYCEFRIVLPRQGLRWGWCQAHPQRMADGGTLWHGIISDITERKKAEEEQAELQAKLQQAQKMESIGRLAGGVAHDFNNLLTVINGYSQLLLEDRGLDETNQRTISEILKAGERAAGLTAQLLAYSRRQFLQVRPLNLNDVVQQMSSMLQRLVGEDVEVCVVLNAMNGLVQADPHQLEQVVMNLAVNAKDAMPGGGKLMIETADVQLDENYVQTHPGAPLGECVMLAMSDTGTGMDKETQRNIFEPFFTTKELGKGTGLGLSTVQGIVAQSGGCIDVCSAPGHGTTFKIYLPVMAQVASDTGAVADTPVLQGHATVLVVEDQPGVLEYAAAALRAYGYRVLKAQNISKALQVLEQERGSIDLVLTDVIMPNGSGAALADELEKRQPGVRVLFMSGYADDAIVRHGVLDERAEFIQKPFSPKQLAIKVKMVLGEQ